MNKTKLLSSLLLSSVLTSTSFAQEYFSLGDDSHQLSDVSTLELDMLGCVPATKSQKDAVNLGNAKKDNFLAQCASATNNSAWCQQLIRPNPDSISKFRCTYGSEQIHQLINPNESTWQFAYTAVRLIQELESKGRKVCRIYNWWRPEPYNKNVGGAGGRHPLGTSVDVEFCSKSEAIKSFDELCKVRKQGKPRALGYYGNTGVHFGVGDRQGNTWGRSCN